MLDAGEGKLEYMAAAHRVAKQFNLLILPCDRSAVKVSISNRVIARRNIRVFSRSLGDAPSPTSDKENLPALVPGDLPRPPRGKNRRGRCGRKRKADAALPSDKGRKTWKGAPSHEVYQDKVKAAVIVACNDIREKSLAIRQASLAMQTSLKAEGITIGFSTCKQRVRLALDSDMKDLTPQKPGGVLVPSSVEEEDRPVCSSHPQPQVPCVS